jgi:tetratricopeptide (TPR) repeat protein
LAAFAAAAALLLAARAFRWGGSFRAAWGRTALIVLACLAAVWVVSELGGPLASGIQTAPKDLAHRARIWSSFIKVGVDFLPLGAGVGAFGAVSSAYADLDLTGERSPEGWFRHAENDYVEFFAETGPVGLLAAFAFLALVFRAVWIAWTHSESSRLRLNLMVGALAGLSASAVHSLVDFSLRMPSNGLLGAALAGLCLSIAVSLSRDWGTRRDETERVAPQDRSSWAFSADALPGRRGRVAIGALSVVLAAGLGWITWRPVWGAAAAEAAQGRLKDEPAKAIATLRWACRAQWRDPEAARLLGRALDPVVNPAAPVKPGSLEALAPYALSAWLAPFDSEARAQLAGAMQRAGTRGDVGAAASLLRDLALLHAQRALRLEPKSFDLRLSLAAAAKASGQADLAKGVVASLLREYPLRWRLVFDGLDASAGDLIMLRDAIPPGAPSHYRFAYHLELRRLPDLARQEYATACEMSAAEDIKERLVSVDRLADLGAADEALRFLDRWVRDHPRDTRYIARRAAVLLKAGQADRAADDYERLLERHPDSLKERLALAGIHERAGRLEQAEKHFRLAVENAPRLAAPYLEMARFQRRIGRPAQAIRTLKDMSGFDATNPAALLELGELYYEAGEVRRATDYFRQAEQHGVSAAEVRARIERAAAAAGRKPAQGPATP